MKILEFDDRISFDHQTSSFSDIEVSSGASVSVKNVTFSLPRSNHTILHDVSFNLSPGGVLGIVGPVSYTHLPSPRDRQKSRMPCSA